SFIQLESAAANIAQILAQQANRGLGFNAFARFLDLLTINQNFAGENQRLCALARLRQSAFEQKFVESDLHKHPPRQEFLLTTEVPASKSVQSVQAFVAELLPKLLSGFSTRFCTVMLKTCGAMPAHSTKNKSRPVRAARCCGKSV